MTSYQYKARDQAGKMIKGVVDASSEEQAMLEVDRRGLIPMEVREGGGGFGAVARHGEGIAVAKAPGKKVPLEDIIVMSRQLLTLLRAGVPILSCLEALAAQTTDSNLKSIILGIQREVETGSVLSAAFAKYPKTFPPMFIYTVRAGETGGVLPEVLMRLSEMMENDLETVRAVKAAIRYPIMVVCALSIAFLVLITFVVPKFAALYARFNTTLPLPTRILIGINVLITEWWYVVIPAITGIGLSLYFFIQTPNGRYLWDKLWLKMPVFGNLIQKVCMMRFAQMFSTLYKAGVPVLRVVEIVSQTLGNSVVGREVAAMSQSIAQGQGLAEPLKKSEYFSPMVVHMVAIGEKSGSIDETLMEVSRHYDLETKYVLRNLTSLIEPMLIVGLGFIVLLLALGILLPMWNLIKLYK